MTVSAFDISHDVEAVDVPQLIELVCQPELIDFYRRWGFTDHVGASRLMRRAATDR